MRILLLRVALVAVLLGLGGTQMARAVEVKVSAQALERTLRAQLFNGPEGRYYMRGDATSACYVYAEAPHVSFKDDRVVVHVHTRAKLGTAVHGACLGLSLTTDADVSLVPEAQGESVGFRDARIERLSENKELNFLLEPFLSHKLPSEMKVNAADLMRKVLNQSVATTGYTLTLDSLKLHSMQVDHNALVLDVDADMSVD
ncbi:MAG: hypothetical protein ABSG84_09465 [Acidobacteriaceae bacterium]|jgi:hypothetical protein